PQKVYEAILNEVKAVKAQGIDKALFEGIKKAALGLRIRTLDSPDSLCIAQTSAYFNGAFFLDFPEIYDSITEDDLARFISNVLKEEASAISIIYPQS
ncbi:MAG: hypothetical protein N2Z65_01175, partial [Clostridiales bacterium]|nr:hypothetical protein [Clostridiales bacterium]